jgi:hypothetical protein
MLGKSKPHAQHLQEAIAYNLNRDQNLMIKLQTAQKQILIAG